MIFLIRRDENRDLLTTASFRDDVHFSGFVVTRVSQIEAEVTAEEVTRRQPLMMTKDIFTVQVFLL